MIVKETGREIERFALNTEKKFTIRASGKAFQILSSSLYRDKIRAIIRELSCNAYDAHVAAGCKDKPFQVHLPNRLEPFFSVRDDGIGLSHEAIESIYTTYFESTKTDSNDYIGALGLGSKSPFSYVDSFTVASRYDGVLRTYAAFVSEYGEPVITLMSQVPTDECNGIEVTIPVKVHTDFHDFRDKAQEVLSRFVVRPIIVGCAEFRFEDHAPSLSGEGWHITNRSLTRNVSYSERVAYAVMGNVAYPVVGSAIKTLSDAAQRVYRLSLDIEFPIGSLEVTAGREDLSYDPRTLKALEEKANFILEEAPKRFVNVFDDCTSEYEARKKHRKMFAHGGIAHSLLKDSSLVLSYKGIDITSDDFLINLKDFPNLMIHVYDSNKNRYRYTSFCATNGYDVLRLSASSDNKIIIDDLIGGRSGAGGQIRLQRKDNARTTLVVVKGDPQQVAALETFLDGFPVLKLSSFPKPEKTSGKFTKAEKIISQITHNMWYRYTKGFDNSCWKNSSLDDLSQGGFYLRKRGNNVLKYSSNSDLDSFKQIFTILGIATNLGLFDIQVPVYGFDAVTERKALALGNWVNIVDHIREKAKLALVNETSLSIRLQRKTLDENYYYLRSVKDILRQVTKGLAVNHTISNFLHAWQASTVSSKQEEDDANFRTLCRYLDIEFPEADDQKLSNQWASIVKNYPLLSALQMHDSDRIFDVAHIIDYVLWIDSKQTTLQLVA